MLFLLHSTLLIAISKVENKKRPSTLFQLTLDNRFYNLHFLFIMNLYFSAQE